MATEKRLIDANAIEYPEYFYTREKHQDPFIEGFHQGKIDAITDIIALAPTVDAVEVVRCKDCKWMVEFTGKHSGKPCGYGRCDNPIGLMGIVYNENYCCYPERRTYDL